MMKKNNAFVLTDLEGISGVSTMDEVMRAADPEYLYVRENLMRDTNAAIDALFSSGAEKVFVLDGHGGGDNFIDGALDRRAKRVSIRELPEVMPEVGCVLMIGMHARSGSETAFLDHTQSSMKIHNYYYNGEPISELHQFGVYAAAFDAPVVMLSGDEAVCLEANTVFGEIPTAAVKVASSRNFAECYPKELSESRIRSAASQGFLKREEIKPLKYTLPLRISVEYNRSDYCEEVLFCRSDLVRTDGRTLERISEKIVTYFDVLL